MEPTFIEYQAKDQAAVDTWASTLKLGFYVEYVGYNTSFIRTTTDTPDGHQPDGLPEECGEIGDWKKNIYCGKTWTDDNGKIMLNHWSTFPKAEEPA